MKKKKMNILIYGKKIDNKELYLELKDYKLKLFDNFYSLYFKK